MITNTTSFNYGKRIHMLMAAAAALCGMALVTACPEADEPPVAVLDLDGDVLDINTDAGIGGVVLSLEPGDYEATTDDSGYWSFAGVPPGSYTLSIDLAGVPSGEYAAWSGNETAIDDHYPDLTLYALPVGEMTIAPNGTGTVVGQVKAPAGGGMPGREVYMDTNVNNQGWYVASYDDDGGFAFNGLPIEEEMNMVFVSVATTGTEEGFYSSSLEWPGSWDAQHTVFTPELEGEISIFPVIHPVVAGTSLSVELTYDGAAFGDCEGELWRNGEGTTGQAYVAGFNFVDGNDWTRGVVHMDGASGTVSFTALAGGEYVLYIPDPESGTVRSKSFTVPEGEAVSESFEVPQPDL